MKNLTTGLLFTAFLLFTGLSANAQDEDKSKRKSPPKKAEATVNDGKVVIDYSAPYAKGREIWGGLVPYDKVWRTGANEATTLMVENDVKIEGETLKAGKYALFTIPGKDEWTFIVNSVWDQWGAYDYDSSKDIMRFTASPEKTGSTEEQMKFEISDDGEVALMWDELMVPFQIE